MCLSRDEKTHTHTRSHARVWCKNEEVTKEKVFKSVQAGIWASADHWRIAHFWRLSFEDEKKNFCNDVWKEFVTDKRSFSSAGTSKATRVVRRWKQFVRRQKNSVGRRRVQLQRQQQQRQLQLRLLVRETSDRSRIQNFAIHHSWSFEARKCLRGKI